MSRRLSFLLLSAAALCLAAAHFGTGTSAVRQLAQRSGYIVASS